MKNEYEMADRELLVSGGPSEESPPVIYKSDPEDNSKLRHYQEV
jgi:hypothetical protein